MSTTLRNHDRTKFESLDFMDFCPHGDRSTDVRWRNLRSAILVGLRRHPYFVLVKRFPNTENCGSLRRLSRILGYFHPYYGLLRLVQGRDRNANIAHVSIDESEPRQSATSDAMGAHTDGPFLGRPYDIIMFHCVVSDQTGGESILVPIDDILEALTGEELTHLREAVFPFGKETAPILTGHQEDQNFRYYRRHMERSRRKRDIVFPEYIIETIEKLDRILASSNSLIRYKMSPQDILILNNKKVLHGRTALTEKSNRLLYRSRIFSKYV